MPKTYSSVATTAFSAPADGLPLEPAAHSSTTAPPNSRSQKDRAKALFDRNYHDVRRTLRRLGVRPSQVDDAVQDVFIVVHRRQHELQPQSERSWLYGIALRVAQNHRRQDRRWFQRWTSQDSTPEPQASSTPEQRVEARQACELLQKLLDSMKPAEREILVSVDIEQLSVVEAARMLELNTNTAYARLRHARIHFDKLLRLHRPAKGAQ